MAFEEIQAEINLLLSQMSDEAEDRREIYQQIHMKLAELKAFGMALPADLVALEHWLEQEMQGAEIGGLDDEEE